MPQPTDDPAAGGRRLDSLALRLDALGYEWTAAPEPGPGVSARAGQRADGTPYDEVVIAPGDALPGVNRLRFDQIAGSLSLDVSAKALLSDYPRGIGLSTLDQLAEAVGRTGLVSVTPEGLLSAAVTAADVFCDVDPRGEGRGQESRREEAVRGAFDALRSLRSNPGYRMTDEGGRTGASLRFRTNRKRGRDELGIYAKGPELAKATNRAFMAAAGSGVYQELADRVRFERRARGPSLVKRFCDRGIRDPFATLADILGSTRLPVSELYEGVKGERQQRALFDSLDRVIEACPYESGQRAWTWVLSEIGYRGVLSAVGWDYDAARELALRVIGNRNAHRVYGDLRERIDAAAAGGALDEQALTAARLDALGSALRIAEGRGPRGHGVEGAARGRAGRAVSPSERPPAAGAA